MMKNFNIGDKITFYKEPKRTETIKAIILDKYISNNFEEMANELQICKNITEIK